MLVAIDINTLGAALLPSVLTRPNRVGNEQYRARWAGGGEGEVPAHRRIDQPAPIGVILDRPQPDAADFSPWAKRRFTHIRCGLQGHGT